MDRRRIVRCRAEEFDCRTVIERAAMSTRSGPARILKGIDILHSCM